MSNFDTGNLDHTAATKHVFFSGSPSDGNDAPRLEGRLRAFADGVLHPGAVLLHANPAGGGHMDMSVMEAAEAALTTAGIATLRYNSRGAAGSAGQISSSGGRRLLAPEGTPETADVGAALNFLAMQEGIDSRHLALVGHSFGARIALAYLSKHPEEDRVKGVVCIGLPVAWRNLSHLGQWPHPKLFITGERDDFCPPDKLEEYVSGLPQPSSQVIVKNTGHFFEGREADPAAAVAEFLARVFDVGQNFQGD